MARNVTTPFAKHTGKKRKLEIAKGVVNIFQSSVTTWSEHAKHHILTSVFDAALISETHLEKEKLGTAAKEARKFSWAGTGSAAISTANNGTSAGVLALVRSRWFSEPLFVCTDETGVLCPNPRLAGRVIRFEGREILLITAYFEHSVGFRSDINANLMQDVFFSRETEGFHSFWERISIYCQACGRTCPCMAAASGRVSWEHQWSFQREPHTCRTGKGQKPDSIDYFLVSTLIRPLIQKCGIVKSVPWGPHYGCAQHQIRNGGVQAADGVVQQAGSAQHERTPRAEHAPH